jgi:GNAT superfamily N-acetyltransferase
METAPNTNNSGANSDSARARLMTLATAAADGYRNLSLSADGGSTDKIAGAACWYSSSYVPVFNGAGIFDPHLITRETLSAIEAYFKWRGRPYSVTSLDALVPYAARLLLRFNFTEYDAMPAMWLDGPPAIEVRGSSDLWVSRVTTPPHLAIFRSLLSQVFHLSMSEVNLVLGEKTLQVPTVRHYLGWLDNTPVAAATLVLSGKVAGVWNVGTLAEYRRQGIAAAIMRHILSDARSLGFQSSMLLASNDGLPLYARLGYETLSTVRVFVPSRQAYG